jgi:DNA-binding GntR family transcriptional regulator
MIQIARDMPQPIYLQISAWLAEQIASGAWPEHYKLKSEIDLAAELGVNRGTVRKAIGELIAEGLLVRIHGLGTFVAARTLEQPLAERLVAFSEDLLAKGIPFETRVLAQAVVAPDRRVASLLGLRPDQQVLELKRVRLVAGGPLILLHNYVIYDRCPGIDAVDFTRQRLLETLEARFGLRLEWGRRIFQAQAATAEVADRLEVAACDPVMYLQQILYLDDGSPIELSDVWVRGDRFRLSAVVRRAASAARGRTSQEFVPEGGASWPDR